MARCATPCPPRTSNSSSPPADRCPPKGADHQALRRLVTSTCPRWAGQFRQQAAAGASAARPPAGDGPSPGPPRDQRRRVRFNRLRERAAGVHTPPKRVDGARRGNLRSPCGLGSARLPSGAAFIRQRSLFTRYILCARASEIYRVCWPARPAPTDEFSGRGESERRAHARGRALPAEPPSPGGFR
jgi:hypothetical protein